jgi:aminoglycoside 3-N-acetyltransferase
MYSRSELAGGFRSLGAAPGDTVMLHASVRAVGPVAGGPDQIHLALKDVLTEQGTLMMYAGCPDHYDEIGLGSLAPEREAELLEKLPAFDPLTARCQRENGALVEMLRTYPGSRVNRHAGARFVAWGRRVDDLFSAQPWNYAYGRGSALERFVALDGKILLLGADHDNVTFLHYAEHVVDIPGKRVVRYAVPVEEHGARVWRPAEEFDTGEGAHPHWPDRFFARLVDRFLAESGARGGKVGDAQAFLLPARGLLDFALPWMRKIAANREAASLL